MLTEAKSCEVNAMAKVNERFVTSGHPVDEKNRPRIVCSPNQRLSAFIGVYNTWCIKLMKRIIDANGDCCNIGLNQEDSENYMTDQFIK